LPSFGEKLKLEREKRKVTLEQISVSTKIGIRMLRALEEDQFDQLPGGIFNKGFVRAYSRVLGLDEDQTVAEYLQASGDAPLVSVDASSHDPTLPGGLPPGLPHNDRVDDAPRRNQHKEPVAEGKIRSLEAGSKLSGQQLPWGIFAALLLIVALALSLWSRYERASSKPASQSTLRVEEPSQPSLQSSGGASSAVVGQVSSPASNPTSNVRLPEASGKDRGTGSSSTTATTVPKPESPGNSALVGHNSQTATNASTPAGELSLVIQAKEESWITITSDGKTVSSELLPAGGELTVHGRQQITVKAGNAGGVEFQFNGKKITAVGQDGEVKTITFGPQGIT
jgi:cytoskeleton protein RodZ